MALSAIDENCVGAAKRWNVTRDELAASRPLSVVAVAPLLASGILTFAVSMARIG